MTPRFDPLSNEELLLVLNLSKDATAIYNGEDMVIRMANDAMIRFWGKDKNVIGKPLQEAVPELIGQPFLNILRDVMKSGKLYEAKEMPAELMVNGELKIFYFDFIYQPVKNQLGETFCILHTASDVTERVLNRKLIEEQKYKEQELNEELTVSNEELSAMNEEMVAANQHLQDIYDKLVITEQKSSLIIVDAPVAIGVLYGLELIIESANGKLLELWGKSQDVIGKPLIKALPELEGQPFLKLLEDVYLKGEAFYGNEIKASVQRNGELNDYYFNFVYHPLKNNSGKTHSVMIVANEVTEQLEMRRKLEYDEYRLNQMVVTAPMGMCILKGRELLVEIANQPMLDMWSRERSEIIGKPILSVLPELLEQPFPDMLEKVFQSGKGLAVPEIMVMNIDKITGHHRQRYVNFTYEPLFNLEGKVESVMVTVINITETVHHRIELEEKENLLQEMNEELAATNEELAAANEEMTVSNEELSAANEQLIYTNDELSSTRDELQQLNNKLKQSEGRLLNILDTLPQLTWTNTQEGIIHFVNQRWCDFSGISFAAIQSWEWRDVIHPDDLQSTMNSYSEILESKTGGEYECRYLADDGNFYWFLNRLEPLYEEEGGILFWIGTATDINERKMNDTRKNDFIAIVSHELKTPLTTVKGYLQLVNIKAKKMKDSFTSTSLDKADAQVNKMSTLIKGFLDIARLEAGKINLNPQRFELNDLVKENVEEMNSTKGVNIKFSSAESFSVVADRDKIGQVLNNLLSNAIKYSPNGADIQVKCEKVKDMVSVSVKDEGMGIDPKDLDKLFDRFYRVESDLTRHISGFGIGLYLSAELIKRHNGKIWAESEKGVGSTFHFQLPFDN